MTVSELIAELKPSYWRQACVNLGRARQGQGMLFEAVNAD